MSGNRVVVVDDDLNDLERLIGLVERAGGEVVGQGMDGEEGLKLAQTLQPDLILTDYATPNMTGPRLASLTEIPTIVVTSGLDETDVVYAQKMGAVAALDKIDRNTIIVAIKQVLNVETETT